MVSVIIPVYNSEVSLERCIQSLLAQVYRDFEIILVDDGSTDSSGAICDGSAGGNVQVIHKENGGISSARNVGLNVAKGKWVTFCDNDDIVSPMWLKRMVDLAESNGEILPMCAYTRNPKELGAVPSVDVVANKLYNLEDYLYLYEQGMAGLVWNSLYRKDVIDRYRIRYPERREIGDINEDLIFQLQYLNYVKGMSFTGYTDYLWTINATNHSSVTAEKWYFEKYEEKYRLLKDFIQQHVTDSDAQLKRLATEMLYHFVWSICNARSYSATKHFVCNDVVQDCVRIADTNKEDPTIIKYIKGKRILSLFLRVRISKLFNHK